MFSFFVTVSSLSCCGPDVCFMESVPQFLDIQHKAQGGLDSCLPLSYDILKVFFSTNFVVSSFSFCLLPAGSITFLCFFVLGMLTSASSLTILIYNQCLCCSLLSRFLPEECFLTVIQVYACAFICILIVCVCCM